MNNDEGIKETIQEEESRCASELYEAYMNEELIIEKGTIEEFISLISNSYDDFVSNNKIYKFAGTKTNKQ